MMADEMAFKYKYNGKELQDELGLNVYDYGARIYEPAAPHFWQIDPLAEKYHTQSPYVYADNNPVMFMDIDGKGTEDDYKFNKKTGKISFVRHTNDKNFDRLLETDGNGNINKKCNCFWVKKSERGKPKVAVDKIKKGILKDGLDLKNSSNSFEVNRKDGPTLKDFDKFITAFSEHAVGKEIAGIRLGKKGDPKVLTVRTYKYIGNDATHSGTPAKWFKNYKSYLKAHFHTHPLQITTPSKEDKQLRDKHPNVKFYILINSHSKYEYKF